jgi:hypothetical protein
VAEAVPAVTGQDGGAVLARVTSPAGLDKGLHRVVVCPRSPHVISITLNSATSFVSPSAARGREVNVATYRRSAAR